MSVVHGPVSEALSQQSCEHFHVWRQEFSNLSQRRIRQNVKNKNKKRKNLEKARMCRAGPHHVCIYIYIYRSTWRWTTQSLFSAFVKRDSPRNAKKNAHVGQPHTKTNESGCAETHTKANNILRVFSCMWKAYIRFCRIARTPNVFIGAYTLFLLFTVAGKRRAITKYIMPL